MALRFRKSIKLAKGIRWNVSGSGSSFSFGPRGASLTVGKRGTFANVGLPGKGLSSRAKIGGAGPRPAAAPALGMTSIKLKCSVTDSGQLEFADGDGKLVPETYVEIAKKQNRDALLGLIQTACDKVNDVVQALARIHLSTPDPSDAPHFAPTPFDEASPVLPAEVKPGFFAGLLAGRREAIASRRGASSSILDMATPFSLMRSAGYGATRGRRRRGSGDARSVRTEDAEPPVAFEGTAPLKWTIITRAESASPRYAVL